MCALHVNPEGLLIFNLGPCGGVPGVGTLNLGDLKLDGIDRNLKAHECKVRWRISFTTLCVGNKVHWHLSLLHIVSSKSA